MKQVKKFIYIVIILFTSIFFFAIGEIERVGVKAENEKYRLSEMSEEEIIDFVNMNNIEIPEEFAKNSDLGLFIKDIVQTVETNPYRNFSFSYYKTYLFAENIKKAVNDYYNIQTSTNITMSSKASYVLEDSILYDNEGWLDYNCYAYAIGKTENPPEYETAKQYQPGDFSNNNFDLNLSIDEMAVIIQEDLVSLGRTNIAISTTRPNEQTNRSLICVRKGEWDYHFMKCTAGEWFHKPGFSAILKYKYIPSNERIWTGEYVDSRGVAHSSSYTYTSTIYYITYDAIIYDYTSDGEQVTITGINTSSEEAALLVLPDKINNKDVVSLASSAFANQTQLTNVILPNTITEIGASAFAGCTNLTSVTLSNSLGIIQEKAFENCVSLTNVNMPSATAISSHAFKGCSSLTNITVPANTTNIGEGAFTGCNALNISVNATNPYYCAENNILYSKDKTYIYATGGISSDVIIPETVTRIEEYAFCNNSNLECVHIYGTPTICSYAFWNCENLEEVYFYSYDVPSIGIGTFTDSIFKLYVPHSSQNAYYTYLVGSITAIDSIPISVAVMENGVLQQTIATYYGATIDGVFTPSKLGYIFDYCIDANGITYENGGVWDSTQNLMVEAYWIAEEPEIILYNVLFDKQGGEDGTDSVNVAFGSIMPTGLVPSREDYIFKGYFAEPNGEGTQYYDANMVCVSPWDMESDGVIYAAWEKVLYEIVVWLTEDDYNNQISEVAYGEPMLPNMHIEYIYNHTGYDFQGIYSEPNGKGVKYFDFEIVKPASEYVYKLVSTGQTWNQRNDGMIYAYWTLIGGSYEYNINVSNADEQLKRTISLTHGTNVTITAPTIDGYTFESMWVNGTTYTTSTVQLNNVQLRRNLGYEFLGNVIGNEPFHIWYMPYGATTNQGGLHMTYKKNECVAAGTLITLADGSQVPVETLTGNERLLVWNLHTGRFDTAPILFIDHDSAQVYKIINLYFSDGTRVKVISEHAFWDFDLNKYVFLREDAAQYLGHWFNKQTTDAMGNMVWTRVQLTSVTITEEYTTAWSPVTYGHLCIYVNGMLSMPGATSGLINIFEVDGETMQINQEQYLADIATYGLFTYEEFAELYPIPEEMFNAVNGQYLKVSIGKGLIDYETLGILIETYSHFFE